MPETVFSPPLEADVAGTEIPYRMSVNDVSRERLGVRCPAVEPREAVPGQGIDELVGALQLCGDRGRRSLARGLDRLGRHDPSHFEGIAGARRPAHAPAALVAAGALPVASAAALLRPARQYEAAVGGGWS